jgi:hypothetical protein
MGLTKHLINGLISLVLSIAIIVLTESDEYEWERSDALASIAIAAFLSGAFTSYFAR